MFHNNKLYLLDENFQIIGTTTYLEYNHIDKNSFKYVQIQDCIFPNKFKIKVFAELNLNTGEIKNKFFEINGVKFKIC